MTGDRPRHLVVVLGDQLDRNSAALDGFDPVRDQIWMAEVAEESTHVPSHQARSALFLAAMRHFADELRAGGWPVDYLALGSHEFPSLATALADSLARLGPERVVWVRPGEHRVRQNLTEAAHAMGLDLEERPDRHFISTPEDFAAWADGRQSLRLEYWYRHLRRRTGLLMAGDQPAGGRWNFDADNRQAFGKDGPGSLPTPVAFPPDLITREAMKLVSRRFADHPGSLAHFDWPVTPVQARAALDDFIAHRLPSFGAYQDAIWSGAPWLYHSRLSAALNLKLIDPLSFCQAAEMDWRDGHAPLAAVEGFIRQILGWRKYTRGLYWHWMPDWLEWNALDAQAPLPGFY
jgi:deoxyribodipyrimidine photolyase-related protein